MHSTRQNRSESWTGNSLPVPGWIRIARPLNLVIIFIGCVVGSMLVHGASITSGDLPYLTSLAGLSAVLVAAFGNITNDMADRRIDAINRTDRPLVSGQLSMTSASLFALFCIAGAVVVAWSLSSYHIVVVMAAGIVLLTYNWFLKRLGFAGTLAIASLVAASIGFGALTGASSGGRAAPLDVIVQSNVLVTMGFAFVLTIARELIKDVEDMVGDRDGGVDSLPLTVGAKQTGRIVRGIVALTIVAAPLPYLILDLSGIYLLMMIPVLALLVRIVAMLGDPEPDVALVSRHLKLGMFLGLFALAFAAVWPV